MPRARASERKRPGFPCGIPPDIATSGFTPISSATRDDAKSWKGAIHIPWSAWASALPGWSMVLELKAIREPSAFIHAVTTAPLAGLTVLKVPL
jgi:hypothetical protein